MMGIGRLLFAGPIGLVLVLTDVQAVWTQNTGHRVIDDQVVVNSRNHWQNWTFPPGTLAISPEGAVQAQRIEKNTNAALDIVDYLRFNPPASLGDKDPEIITVADAIRGGSNVADVAKVFDGDMSTYWEPAPPSDEIDLASQWWFVVDLGRMVFANKLVVRFVEEGLGDPFLLFEVLFSDGLKPARLQGSGSRSYEVVLRTLSRNKSQRVFEVDLIRQVSAPEGSPVRFVQLLVTGTDGLLGAEITRAEYEALAEGRGAVQYFKRQLDGREVPVAQKVYELLDEERRGRIRYFRRERPRLAELEVWNKGDELVAGILDRGGTISTSATQTLPPAKFYRWRPAEFCRHFLRGRGRRSRSRKGTGLRSGCFLLDRYLFAGLLRILRCPFRSLSQISDRFFRRLAGPRRQPRVDHQSDQARHDPPRLVEGRLASVQNSI